MTPPRVTRRWVWCSAGWSRWRGSWPTEGVKPQQPTSRCRRPGRSPARTCSPPTASRRHLIDGYKRHVLTDLDSGLVPAVGVTQANVPEAQGAEQIRDDLDAQQARLAELFIDRAYLSSTLVRDRPDDLEIFCKAWRVRNGPRFAKTDFTLDWHHQQLV